MAHMQNDIKEFIENNIFFLDNDLFGQFYELADQDLIPVSVSELTECLYECGITPLERLNFIPKHFLCGSNVGGLDFIPSHITKIGSRAFDSCVNLQRIDLRHLTRLQYIDEGAFYNCNECEYLYLPDSLKIIAKNAFDYCSSLQYIKMGSNLAAIGFDAFRNCFSLLEIEIDMSSDDFFKNVTVAKSAFFLANSNCIVKFKDKQLDFKEFLLTLDGLK